ncbi:MAG: GntR family transcriptional regulator [Streptosporangiaceae bacterium]
MPPNGTKSLTEKVYTCLRADILAGRFPPEQRLRPTELATAHGVSLNVVREALSRLAGERLVKASAQQGFAVPPVSTTDLAELTDLRALVECEALRRAISRGDLAWESEVVAAHHRLANTPMTIPDHPEALSIDWMPAHNAFHAATMSGCGSRRLIELTASLGEAAAIYRYWSQFVDHGRDVAGEHRAIFEATVARDADLACRLHREHIQRTADIVTAAMRGADPGQTDQPARDEQAATAGPLPIR